MVDRARGAGTDIDGTYPYQIAEARIDRIEPGTGVTAASMSQWRREA